MKAYKCCRCNYFNIPNKKGRTYGKCPKCYPRETEWELIEIIDWEYELITNESKSIHTNQ